MKYEPHDYQVYASEYIKEHDAAAVFLECGLGKTSITLTAICDLMFDSFEIHKVLTNNNRFCDGEKYSVHDYVATQTFPEDYDFMDQEVNYVCGMSVPPVMMANIASEVYRQWLKYV